MVPVNVDEWQLVHLVSAPVDSWLYLGTVPVQSMLTGGLLEEPQPTLASDANAATARTENVRRKARTGGVRFFAMDPIYGCLFCVAHLGTYPELGKNFLLATSRDVADRLAATDLARRPVAGQGTGHGARALDLALDLLGRRHTLAA